MKKREQKWVLIWVVTIVWLTACYFHEGLFTASYWGMWAFVILAGIWQLFFTEKE